MVSLPVLIFRCNHRKWLFNRRDLKPFKLIVYRLAHLQSKQPILNGGGAGVINTFYIKRCVITAKVLQNQQKNPTVK